MLYIVSMKRSVHLSYAMRVAIGLLCLASIAIIVEEVFIVPPVDQCCMSGRDEPAGRSPATHTPGHCHCSHPPMTGFPSWTGAGVLLPRSAAFCIIRLRVLPILSARIFHPPLFA